jgi:hypothetical protein
MVMSNFRYDVDLAPSMFSLDPPAGYSTQTISMTMPVEEDLLRTLRTIAEHNKGLFPAKLGMNEEVMKALTPPKEFEQKFKMDAEMNAAMEAEMDKVAAKYGGKDKLKARIGKDKQLPPEMMSEFMKATEPLRQKQAQKLAQQGVKVDVARQQKQVQGVGFYLMLKPENDPHYIGGGVKLGAADRPILWYKPTDAEKYRVIYADLTVKELTPEEVKKLSEAKPK